MTDDAPVSGLGHNSGIPAEQVRDHLGIVFASYVPRRDEMIASAGRAKIDSNDAVGKAGDLRALISTFRARLEDRVDETIEPHVQAERLGKAMFQNWVTGLDKADRELAQAVEKFRADQRDAAKRQQDEQRAEEAARRAALAKPIEVPAPAPTPIALPAVRGDYGSRTGDRKVQNFEIKDVRKVDLRVLKHPKVAEAMQAACRDIYKIDKKITGVVVHEDMTTTVRKK